MGEGPEQVVLLHEDGSSAGVALKAQVHTTDTPLHLGFSCHLLDSDGHVLVTRRSLHKRTWPGVWTNSFCGHPRPSEEVEEAVRRHAQHELGLSLSTLTLSVPDFRYRATDASGTVENEICPVFTATADSLPTPNPDEVAEMRWVRPDELGAAIDAAPWAFSPWLVRQASQIALYRERP